MLLTKVAWGCCGVWVFTFAKIVSRAEHYGLVSAQNRHHWRLLRRTAVNPRGVVKWCAFLHVMNSATDFIKCDGLI